MSETNHPVQPGNPANCVPACRRKRTAILCASQQCAQGGDADLSGRQPERPHCVSLGISVAGAIEREDTVLAFLFLPRSRGHSAKKDVRVHYRLYHAQRYENQLIEKVRDGEARWKPVRDGTSCSDRDLLRREPSPRVSLAPSSSKHSRVVYWLLTDFTSIVAVHGLNGDAFRTFTSQTTGQCWLSQLDMLPRDLPRCRVLTFSYPAVVAKILGKTSSDRILQHAQTLIAELVADREVGHRVFSASSYRLTHYPSSPTRLAARLCLFATPSVESL
jgi:hypothetical protein